MSETIRLDELLLERGLAPDREVAVRMVMAGEVRVDGQLAVKAAQKVARTSSLELDRGEPFVSRGGRKLEAALDAFGLDVSEWVCADVGASTGGFTDCLLQRGAARVYAIDVGKGLLDWRLRQDERVVVMESSNARKLAQLPEPVDLVTLDVAFISLRTLLPVVNAWLLPAGSMVALVKPQFEARAADIAPGGVVKDAAVRRQVLEQVIQAAVDLELGPKDLMLSPLRGPKGNREYLLWLAKDEAGQAAADLLARLPSERQD